MHPTLVVRKKSKTTSVARPSHRSLTEGARGRFHSHAFSISFHILFAYGAHAWHLVEKWCRDWGSPLAHYQYSPVSVISNRSR